MTLLLISKTFHICGFQFLSRLQMGNKKGKDRHPIGHDIVSIPKKGICMYPFSYKNNFNQIQLHASRLQRLVRIVFRSANLLIIPSRKKLWFLPKNLITFCNVIASDKRNLRIEAISRVLPPLLFLIISKRLFKSYILIFYLNFPKKINFFLIIILLIAREKI